MITSGKAWNSKRQKICKNEVSQKNSSKAEKPVKGAAELEPGDGQTAIWAIGLARPASCLAGARPGGTFPNAPGTLPLTLAVADGIIFLRHGPWKADHRTQFRIRVNRRVVQIYFRFHGFGVVQRRRALGDARMHACIAWEQSTYISFLHPSESKVAPLLHMHTHLRAAPNTRTKARVL